MSVQLCIAMIFRNDIRTLERCLSSLRLLEGRVTYELIMADTGSNDGSRAVAERYADELFDFPWAGDFSAARNAVLSHVSAQWALTLDSDEWLTDADELAKFLDSPEARLADVALVVQRNYLDPQFKRHSDFFAPRMMRMDAGPYYVGAIHEVPYYKNAHSPISSAFLRGVVLHHDGYVMLNDGSEAGRAKRRRNLAVLRKEREVHPDDLRTLSQLADSSDEAEERLQVLRHAAALIEAQGAPKQIRFEPGLLAAAVREASAQNLPELEHWAALAEKLFPTHYKTRIDIAYLLMLRAINSGRTEEAGRLADGFLQALARSETDPALAIQSAFSSLLFADRSCELDARIVLADAALRTEKTGEAVSQLQELPWAELNEDHIAKILMLLAKLYYKPKTDIAPLMTELWFALSEDNAGELRRHFFRLGAELFDSDGWRIFLPLAGLCLPGDAASLMLCETAEQAERFLVRIREPAHLPDAAFIHAMRLGCRFPLHPLQEEDATELARKLSGEPELLKRMALEAAESLGSSPLADRLLWADALLCRAMQSVCWKDDKDALPIARAFADTERRFLPLCYTEQAQAALFLLPPLHRLGLFLTRAFDALDTGDTVGCVRALRSCTEHAPAAANIAERLSAEIRSEERRAASPELRQLAEQVRAILAQYPPDAPEVTTVKQSAAYRKVAWLIEE